ncbi:MAG TPA: PQQ-binding-like beta-propeller repeat protein, partial [Thermomicrobiales bacterium]
RALDVLHRRPDRHLADRGGRTRLHRQQRRRPLRGRRGDRHPALEPPGRRRQRRHRRRRRTLYVGADAGVLALDVATGTERWRYAAGGAVSSRMPAFADGVVYDGTTDGNLNALNATDGSIVWQFKTDGGRFTTPTVADGIVFQGNPDAPVQRLYALDAKTGAERWRFAAGVQAYAAAVGGGLAYVNAGDGAVYALDAATGQLRWRFATGAPNLGNGPALVGDTLYVAGEDGNLYALDASSGELRWQVTVGESAIAPVITGGMVYFETVNGSLVALGDASAAPGGTTAVAGGEGATPAAPTTAATPNAATLIWTTQGGADGLVNPADLAIDPQGRLWVADNAHSRFQLFSADGTFLQTFGEGTFRFGINGASSGEVAFAPDGTTYVVDATARTVSKFDPNGRLVAAWGGTSSVPVHLSQPENLVVDAAGTVWVGGDGLHAIFHLDPDGQVLGTITDSPDLRLEAIGGMAIDGAGDLYLVNGASHIVELRPDGTLLRTLSDFNDPDGTFNGTPIFMTVDKSGNLFVTAVDWSANPLRGRIEVFAPDGTVVVASGWAGQFPTGIALDGAGNVYIADYNENTVQKFRLLPPLASAPTDATVAPTSAATTASPAATTGPAAALVRQAPAESVDGWLASDGKLWVADGDRNHYRILSPADGHEVEVWQATMPDGVAYGLLAFGPQGEIYIYDIATHRVAKFDRDRHFVFVWGGTGTGDGQFVGDVYGLVVDRAGNVSVADGGRNLVQKFDADGHFLLKWGGTGPGNGQFADMGWPTVDAAGNVYVPDIGNNRVEKFDPDGTFLSAFGSFGPGDGELNAPNDVAVDAAGNVYVADWKNSRVEVFDAAGRYAAEWGGFGHAEGQFTHVDGVELDNQGNIYVADPDARHIDKFHLLPPLAPAT